MKLYAWQPRGHGQLSFFVMAESKSKAIEAVEKETRRIKSESNSDYKYSGWGTEYYELLEFDAGQVAVNDNG